VKTVQCIASYERTPLLLRVVLKYG